MLSERIEAGRAVLYHAKMPLNFWTEAVVHVADIRNRFLFSGDKEETSYELLTASKPRVDHLRVFGSQCWTFVLRKLRKKLEPVSVERVLIACYEYSTYKEWFKDGTAPTRHVRIQENSFKERSWYFRIPNAVYVEDEAAGEQEELMDKHEVPSTEQRTSQSINLKQSNKFTAFLTPQ